MLKIVMFVLTIVLLTSGGIRAIAATSDPTPQHVLVVLIFDEGCKVWCQKVRPIMKELKEQYGQRVDFLELDASAGTMKETEAKAKEAGVVSFLHDSADWVPIVGVFSPKRRLIKELVGPKSKDTYVSVIDKALSSN
jgi:hypothetical protein